MNKPFYPFTFSPENPKFYDSIQALRAMAAIYVCLFHISYWWNLKHDALDGLFAHGASGVDLFFVISGFVIVQKMQTSGTGYSAAGWFLAKRMYRIYPLYWLVLIVTLVVNPVIFQTTGLRDLLEAIFLVPGHRPILIISWTLGYELYFYFLISLAILYKPFRWILALLLFCSFVSTASRTIPGLRLLPVSGIYNGYVSEFLLGGLAFPLSRHLPVRVDGALAGLGLILFFLPVPLPGLETIKYGIASFFLISGLVALEKRSVIRIPAWLRLMGDASYALYLIHLLLIQAFLSVPAKPWQSSRLLLLGIVGIMVVCSVLVYVFIDRKTQQLFPKRFRKNMNIY